MACINPIEHYKLDVGLCRVNDPADFIIVKDLQNFEVINTYINGTNVAESGKTFISSSPYEPINNFKADAIDENSIHYPYHNQKTIPVIEALDGELITHQLNLAPKVENQLVVPDIERDILKIVVVNRYQNAPPAVSFIKNFGLKKGALAGSIAHDSHNIICVGVCDKAICEAINQIIEAKGGITYFDGKKNHTLKLEVAGLMTGADGFKVAQEYIYLDKLTKQNGASLQSPFMTLSFMALLVIPSLKLSDKGLFDGDHFKFVDKKEL
jgi:adenine deaminase